MLPLILASTSPRRKEIMDKLRLPYEAVAPDYEEDMTLPMDPVTLAGYLARGKAESLQETYTDHLIIWADTFCALDGKLLGKPKNREDARHMLTSISGQVVSIITGLALLDTRAHSIETKVDTGLVYFETLTPDQIDRYLSTGERTDKAGAFAIQYSAGAFIKKTEWDYNTIMGLPLHMLYCSLYEAWYFSKK